MAKSISELMCETDAAWREFCDHPSDQFWELYVKAKQAEDEANIARGEGRKE